MNLKIDITIPRRLFQDSGNFSTPGWLEAFKALNLMEDLEQAQDFNAERTYNTVELLLRAATKDLKWLGFLLSSTEYLTHKQNQKYPKI